MVIVAATLAIVLHADRTSPPNHLATSRSGPGSGAAQAPRLPAPTTVPARPAFSAVSTSPYAAVYSMSSAAMDLSLVTQNRCWIELRSGSAAGPVVFEGILSSGEQKSFSDLAGGLWLRIGYPPGVVMHIDGSTVTVPSVPAPYDVTVESPPVGSA